MQWMEADTTSARIKEGRSQQMVKVNEHSKQENYVDAKPFLSVDKTGNDDREDQVEKIVKEMRHDNVKYPKYCWETKGS